MASKGIRVLAAFNPCRLVDGGAILNLPSSNNNLKLLAVDLEGSGSDAEVHKAVVMDLQRIQRITNDQILYNVGFGETVTGESPIQIIQTLFRILMPYSCGMTRLKR
jgi:hypothetical protein